jgi:hypothetical protein
LRGREVLPEQKYSDEKIEIDISQLSQGTYILQIKESQRIQFIRLLKTD